jgi:hypothetical protein
VAGEADVDQHQALLTAVAVEQQPMWDKVQAIIPVLDRVG